MAKRYRLTRIHPSSGPRPVEELLTRPTRGNEAKGDLHVIMLNDSGNSHERNSTGGPGGSSRGTRGRWWPWAFVAVMAVILASAVVMWMHDVSGSLTHLNQTVQQNSQALSDQNTLLGVIHTQLQQVSKQLYLISQQIGSFFGKILQVMHS